jgi:hypothetical protein
MSPLLKIQSEGFQLSLKETGVAVVPASKLTQEQREFIKAHKDKIITELSATDDEPKYKRFVVIRDGVSRNVTSPSGLTLSAMRAKFAKSEVEILH